MGHKSYLKNNDSDFYGYDTNNNTDLIQSRHMDYKTGGTDPTHYNIDGASGNNFANYKPTTDWRKDSGIKDDFYRNIDTSKLTSDWNINSRNDGDDAHKAAMLAAGDDDQDGHFSGNTIEHIRRRITGQNVDGAAQMVTHWTTIQQSLQSMYDALKTPTDQLVKDDSWTGDSAKAFIQMGPGATLKSLNDWIDAAQYNIEAFQHVHDVLPGYHKQIEDLYTQYKGAMASESVNYFKDMRHDARDPDTGMYLHNANELMDKGSQQGKDNFIHFMKSVGAIYDLRARDIEFAMAGDYKTAIASIQQGYSTTFEGPSNAIMDMPGMPPPPSFSAPNTPGAPGAPNARAMARPNVKAMAKPNVDKPNINKPNAPTPNVDRPNAPDVPNTPTTPNAPNAPNAPNTPNATPPPAPVAPPAVAPPVAPVTAPALGARAAPSPLSRTATQNAFRPNVNRPGQPAVNRSGVLGDRTANSHANASRPSAPGGEGEGRPPSSGRGAPANPTKPTRTNGKSPSRPGGSPEEGSQGRPNGSRSPASPSSNRKNLERKPGSPGAPAEGEEGGMPSRPAGTSPSVLNGKRTRTPDPASTDAQRLSGRPGSGAPGTTKPVLNNRGPNKPARKNERHTPARPVGSVGSWPLDDLNADPPTATTPVLDNPTRYMRDPSPTDTNDVPASLRPRPSMPSGTNLSSSRPGTHGASELAARKAAQKEKERREKVDQEYEKIRLLLNNEEPWTVETPGGPVIANQHEHEQVAHPRPKLGA